MLAGAKSVYVAGIYTVFVEGCELGSVEMQYSDLMPGLSSRGGEEAATEGCAHPYCILLPTCVSSYTLSTGRACGDHCD